MIEQRAVCLDTRVTSWYLRGKLQARQLVEKLKQEKSSVYTTTVNIAEYYMGYYKISPTTRIESEKLKEFFIRLDPRPLDYKAARLAGELLAGPLKGKDIGWRDTFIAAICLNNGGRIATNNARHFRRVPDLEVIEFP